MRLAQFLLQCSSDSEMKYGIIRFCQMYLPSAPSFVFHYNLIAVEYYWQNYCIDVLHQTTSLCWALTQFALLFHLFAFIFFISINALPVFYLLILAKFAEDVVLPNNLVLKIRPRKHLDSKLNSK